MAATVPNLWPAAVLDVSQIRTPLAILREQASNITDMTKGLVQGVVSTGPGGNDGTFSHHFRLMAPALGNYFYTLLHVSHGPVDLYPVRVMDFAEGRPRERNAQDERTFTDLLRGVFAEPRTTKIVQGMIVQSIAQTSRPLPAIPTETITSGAAGA